MTVYNKIDTNPNYNFKVQRFRFEKTDANLNFDISVDKDQQVYCFFGENGVGKTNFFENVAKTLVLGYYCFLYDFHLPLQEFVGKYVQYVHLADKVTFDDGCIISTELESIYNTENKTFVDVLKKKNITERYIDTPIVFISAKERGYIKNLDTKNLPILGTALATFEESFTKTIKNITKEVVETSDIAEWFSSRMIINPAFTTENDSRMFEVEMVIELIERLEPSFKLRKEDGTLDIHFTRDNGLLLGNIPIDKLSTGFVSIVRIFQEIVAGIGAWIGLEDKTDIANAEAVVFIDELESHLHPKWQYQIIGLLKEFFPKATFFIATHSPLIVSTTEEGEAYELIRNGDNVTCSRLGNPQNWYLVDVFSQAFHVNFKKKLDSSLDLMEQLKDFSLKVRTYAKQKDESLKQEIERLYQKILPNFADDDPRRRSLDSLKDLVK